MRSKSFPHCPVSTGDIVHVIIKRQNKKLGSWSSPKPDLAYDYSSRSVVVPDRNAKKITADLEDTRLAVVESDLAIKVQQAIDNLQASLELSIDDATDRCNDEDDARRSQSTSEADGNSADQQHFDV